MPRVSLKPSYTIPEFAAIFAGGRSRWAVERELRANGVAIRQPGGAGKMRRVLITDIIAAAPDYWRACLRVYSIGREMAEREKED